ncbi:hypothetical protein [Streptoalloteichus tenebrarius]|nr:hypothetical protein [Streptoalloteichus tenebrarius]
MVTPWRAVLGVRSPGTRAAPPHRVETMRLRAERTITVVWPAASLAVP